METPYIKVDTEANAAYMHLLGEPVVETRDIGDGILVDLAADGRVVGIEFLNESAMDLFQHLSEQLAGL